VALLALVNHVVKFDFQALLSFDQLQTRRFGDKPVHIHVAFHLSLGYNVGTFLH
jgi:hypothetical protein